MLARVVEMAEAGGGPDIRPRARAVALELVPGLQERADELLADRFAGEPAPRSDLAELYEELRTLSAADDEDGYRATLARLRDLQEAEARQMAAYFDAHRPLQPAEAEAALSRAKALIAEYDDPPPPDAAAHDAD